MPFSKMKQPKYPLMLWELVGRPGVGKTNFLTQMPGSLLPIDADHRWDEVYKRNPDVLQLSENPLDHVIADRIVKCLDEGMPDSGCQTIAVDSLTAIITPLVVKAIRQKALGEIKNQMAGFKEKAMAMRLLQDGVTKWGVNVVWVWHLMDARDENAKELVRATLSPLEVARLHRSVNAQLEMVMDEAGRRGVKVAWCRSGRSGMTVWDWNATPDTYWQGVPEKLNEVMYDGLTAEDRQQIEAATPSVFAKPELAVAWGFEQAGAFNSLQHAQNAFKKLWREARPAHMADMTPLWVADVRRRQQQPDLFNDEAAHGSDAGENE